MSRKDAEYREKLKTNPKEIAEKLRNLADEIEKGTIKLVTDKKTLELSIPETIEFELELKTKEKSKSVKKQLEFEIEWKENK
ncbi:MAG: amphi-Trp domain-containing protein [Candidatus Marinimicrobia bacterium]|nr:amphi-Trp domain-containing protein [Candidatus Neomarinimicrobiota bacterium]